MSFEEEYNNMFYDRFPKLTWYWEFIDGGKRHSVVKTVDVSKYCLDKQRVREAIENMVKGSVIDRINANTLLKELGLNDSGNKLCANKKGDE